MLEKPTNYLPRSQKLCKTIVVLGGNEVGKTSILQRYTKRRFEQAYCGTIGLDYYSKEIETECIHATLSIWDTCGQESELKILPPNVYKIASAYFIVCSYDDPSSAEMLKTWINHILNYLSLKENANPSENMNHLIPIMVLINKSDIIANERQFQIDDIVKTIDNYNLNIWLYEVSAKTNYQIEDIFEKIAALITGCIKWRASDCMNMSLCRRSDVNTTMETMNYKRRKSFHLKEEDKNWKDKVQGGCCK